MSSNCVNREYEILNCTIAALKTTWFSLELSDYVDRSRTLALENRRTFCHLLLHCKMTEMVATSVTVTRPKK